VQGPEIRGQIGRAGGIGRDVGARVFTLAPGKEIPWHFQSAVTDWYFVLEGVLSIENASADRPSASGRRRALPDSA
jgi:mannose-6-phosphate isomerase-like protein (cupin superfamily)